ncbi:MAG: hypothetical protein U9N51_06310 [Bacteroidota bacterium]|nr:hypothetical protein [Bacteroidota bacterium]
MFVFVFNPTNLYAQGQGQGGPPIWRLDGNNVGNGDFLGTTNNMPLVFKINNTESMRLLPDGNVGIGLTNPEASLDVNGNAIFRDGVYIENKLKVGSIMLYAEGNNLFVPGERGYLYIQSRHDSKHTIINYNNPGYVGIGTDNPGKKLHVKETRSSSYNANPRQPIDKVNIDSTLMDQNIRERDSLITNTEKRGSIRLELTVPQEGKSTTWDIQPTVSNYTNKMPSSLHFIDAEKKHTVMTMQDNGAVGIGTISPSSRLHVHGGNLILTKGRMGIGMQRPQAALDVNGYAHVKDGIKIGDYTSAYMYMEIDDSPMPCEGNSWSLFNGYSHCGMGIKFFTNTQNDESTEKMRITPDGKVVIKSPDPDNEIDGVLIVENSGRENERTVIIGDDENQSLFFVPKLGSEGWNSPLVEEEDVGIFFRNGINNENESGLVIAPQGTNGNGIRIAPDGNVGIGLSNPRERLTVKGKILSEENIVVLNAETSSYPDYVFEDTYNPISLSDLDNYISEHKHLPEIPTAEEFKKEGMKLGEMNIKLLKKIEELTIYTIEQQKTIENLKTRIEKLEEE